MHDTNTIPPHLSTSQRQQHSAAAAMLPAAGVALLAAPRSTKLGLPRSARTPLQPLRPQPHAP